MPIYKKNKSKKKNQSFFEAECYPTAVSKKNHQIWNEGKIIRFFWKSKKEIFPKLQVLDQKNLEKKILYKKQIKLLKKIYIYKKIKKIWIFFQERISFKQKLSKNTKALSFSKKET